MQALQIVHNFMLESGISIRDLLARTDLDEADFEDPYNIISTTQGLAYLQNAATLSKTGSGLETGYATRLADMGVRGLAEITSATVHDAVMVGLTHPTVLFQFCKWRMQVFEKIVIVYMFIETQEESLAVFLAEQQIGEIQSNFEELSNSDLKPTRILLNYPKPANYKRYQEIFGCPVLFDQPGIEMHYPANYLDIRIKTHDPQSEPLLSEMTTKLQDKLKSNDNFANEVMQYLRRQKGRLPTLTEVAETFSISPRTLHRRLVEHDSSFQELIDGERLRVAEYLLCQTSTSVAEISARMGYQNSQNFSQAFRGWTGMSPSEYRAANSN